MEPCLKSLPRGKEPNDNATSTFRRRPTHWFQLTKSLGLPGDEIAIVNNKTKVSESQLRRFLELCWIKYVKAKIEPGESPTAISFSARRLTHHEQSQVRLSVPLVLSQSESPERK